jgi:hypothetical protein
MPRKPAPKAGEQREIEAFAERYDTLVSIFRDPVEFIFEFMSNSSNPPELRLSAARTLTEFRYPKLKSVENKSPNTGPVMQFNINLTQATGVKTEAALPAPREIDVTPPQIGLTKKAS